MDENYFSNFTIMVVKNRCVSRGRLRNDPPFNNNNNNNNNRTKTKSVERVNDAVNMRMIFFVSNN